MKKIYQFLGMCLFLSVIAFTVVSCNTDDSLENYPVDAVSDDGAVYRTNQTDPGGTTVDPTLEYIGYYTWVTCGSSNPGTTPNGIAEYKAFFEDKNQCVCWSARWMEENCTTGGATSLARNWCTYTSRPEKPNKELCFQ